MACSNRTSGNGFRRILLILGFGMTVGSLFAATNIVVPQQVQAQDDREAAREQFALGVRRFEAMDFNGALTAFQEAYRLAPHPSVRVNMANCYERLDRPLEALHHFEAFLSEAQEPSAQQRAQVEAAVARLRQRVGTVSLTIAPDGAMVTIDNAETRRAPVVAPVLLTAGTHEIRVSHDGYATETRRIQIEGGGSSQVEIRLQIGQSEPETGEETTGPEETAEDDGPSGGQETGGSSGPEQESGGGYSGDMIAAIAIAGALAVALGGAAAGTGVAAMLANDDFDAAVARYQAAATDAERATAQQEGQDAADTANTMSVVTDILWISAVAAAGATLFFIIAGAIEGQADQEYAGQSPSIQLGAAAAPGGGIVGVSGRF